MTRQHNYSLTVEWTGNTGSGTSSPRAYRRDHELRTATTTTIAASSDPAFRGDRTRWNPEQLLVASIAECHMLWYLDLAARAGIIVTAYRDDATGVMTENADGGGQFAEVTLHPVVTISAGSDPAVAQALHAEVGKFCFIARSVNFPVHHAPSTHVAAVPADQALPPAALHVSPLNPSKPAERSTFG